MALKVDSALFTASALDVVGSGLPGGICLPGAGLGLRIPLH